MTQSSLSIRRIAVSALLMSVIGYISLKYKKGWVEKLMIRIGHRKNRREKPQEESA